MDSSTPSRLYLDIETYCEIDISKAGVDAYVSDPSFEILLISYALNGEEVQCIDLTDPNRDVEQLNRCLKLLTDPSIWKVAHNAEFERLSLEHFTGAKLPIQQWDCTMTLAKYGGLPASLDELSQRFRLGAQGKLAVGKQLIKMFSAPQKKGKRRIGRLDSPDSWETFEDYCKRDVEACRALYARLKGYAPTQRERQIYELDSTINRRGVQVDVDFVQSALAAVTETVEPAGEELMSLTGITKASSVLQLKNWLLRQGYSLEAVNKSTVAEFKAMTTDPLILRVLELRETVSKAASKKYEAILKSLGRDGRLRGMFRYYGAQRTGRWAGQRVQLQNLKRNNIPDIAIARQCVKDGDLEGLKFGWPDVDVNELLGQLVRTALVPKAGCKFIIADYSAIEARVLAWLAGESWRMEVFRQDGDIYKSSYAQAFGIPVDEVTKEMRQKGKIMELALGYGGSVGALKAFGADKLGLSDSDLRALTERWRHANSRITRFWCRADKAVTSAIEDGAITWIGARGNVLIRHNGSELKVRLPSGRDLVYQDCRCGQDRKISYMSLEHKHWGRVVTHGGKLVENITQAVARDCLAEAMLALEAKGYEVVAHIHDEVIIEAPQNVSVAEVEYLMGCPISWAPGLTLTAKGYEGDFYYKD